MFADDPYASQSVAVIDGSAGVLSKGKRWDALPALDPPEPEGRSAMLFAGVAYETTPRRLLTDRRLTPLDRNAWQVFRLLMDGSGLSDPNYQELSQFLPTIAYGKRASKETVARVILILRLTRWITLITRERDVRTGQMKGCLYLVYDDSVTVPETSALDTSYTALVSACLTHPNKSVRLVAEGAKADIEASDGRLPTRLDVIAERVAERSKSASSSAMSRNPNKVEQYRTRLSSESELGQKEQSSESELGEIRQKTLGSESELSTKKPSSESEPGEKPTRAFLI